MTAEKPGIHAKFLKIPDDPYKKRTVKIKYNEAMKQELLRCKTDPEYFLRNYYYIQTMVGNNGKMKRELFQPFPYQITMIENFMKYPDNIAMLGRQLGKCCKNTTLIKIKHKDTGEIHEIAIGDLFEQLNKNTTGLIYRNHVKFEKSLQITDWEIESDTGWNDISSIHKTIPYEVWELKTENYILECADDHIVFDANMKEVLCKDLRPGDYIMTKTGIDKVIKVHNTKAKENMFDVTVESNNHRFYSNSILSHNTTLVGGLILWLTMFFKDEEVLIVANNKNQALEIMERVQFGYENCPDFVRAAIKNDGYAKGHMYFDNGSKIVARATTPHAGRGLSISLLYVDEFAAIQPNMQADFWAAISQTLSTGGRAFITSTPYTEHDTFASLWRGATRFIDHTGKLLPENGPGANGFKAIKATWKEHPDRDEEWERQQRAKIGDDGRFEREQNCVFIGYSESLINGAILKKILEETEHKKLITMTGDVRWWKRPEKGCTYIVGYDPSLGTGGDFAAIQVFELPEMIQVAEWQSNALGIPDQMKVLRSILSIIDQELRMHGDNSPEIYWTVENNTVGEAALVVIEEIGEENYAGDLITEPTKTRGKRVRKGYYTSGRTKIAACSKFKTLVEKSAMTINSKVLARQLSFYVASGAAFAAKLGEHDDLVAATLLVIRLLDQVMWYNEEQTQDLRESIGEEEIAPMGIFF